MMNSGASGIYYNNSTWRGYWDGSNNLQTFGDVVAYASDKRLKTNIKNIPDALGKVLSINGVFFDWDITECDKWGFKPPKEDVGVLAQEVQAVLPEAVKWAPFDRDPLKGPNSVSGKDYLTVQYEKVVPLLIEAIKELNAKIEKLENK
jgi:hypothetical protein